MMCPYLPISHPHHSIFTENLVFSACQNLPVGQVSSEEGEAELGVSHTRGGAAPLS